MGFAINKKVADKKAAATTKTTPQAGGSSKFIAKANTKSSGGANKNLLKLVDQEEVDFYYFLYPKGFKKA